MSVSRVSIILCALLPLVSACSSTTATKKNYEIEVVTAEQLIDEEIAKANTEFMVPFSDDEIAWSRTRIFFERYLNGEPGEFTINRNRAQNKPTESARFYYSVSREPLDDGMQYHVSCNPVQPTDRVYADRNAKNLARFISEGTLELTLLVQ